MQLLFIAIFGVVDAEVPHRALDLTVTQQQLDGAKIACAAVDERYLRSPQRVGT